MAIPTGIVSHQERAESEERERTEKRLAAFGRRMVEMRIASKKERKIRAALGATAFRHIHASEKELKERLLEIFDGAKFFLTPTEDEIRKELDKLHI